MRNKIMTLLRDLEKQHNIKILMAVNYGSRCFGYSSAESDWDVRFIYVHRPEWYFSIAKTEDVIEMMVEEGHLDIEGYELKKALNLLARTNPIESDWLHADDYYILDEDFRQKMLSFEAQCYNSHHAMYHFYSIGAKHNQRYLDKEVTLKRFIYYMRGLLSCRWVEQHGCHPPVNADELIDVTITDNENVREKAHRLLETKRTGKSHDMEIVDMELSDYMFALQKYYEKLLPSHIDSKPKVDIPSMSKYLMEVVLQNERNGILSERFRAALMQTRGITLTHSSGEKSPYKTIITEQELCQILTDMRDNYDKHDKHLERKKRVFVDMDNVLVDFESGLAQVSEEVKKEYEGRLDEIPGLFGLMKPMPEAIFAMHELQKHYDLFILSTAPWKNPSAWSDKVTWVTKYLDDVFHKRVVITHRKDLCQGDYLIDDRGKNGTSEFAGEWIEFGSEKFPDWNSVLVYLGAVSQEHLDFIESFDRDADRATDGGW